MAAYTSGIINISAATDDIVIIVESGWAPLEEYRPSWLGTGTQSTTIPTFNISHANLPTALEEMPDHIDFIFVVTMDYWVNGRNIAVKDGTASWSQTDFSVAYTTREYTVDGIRYGVITITKIDLQDAYDRCLADMAENPNKSGYGFRLLPGNGQARYTGEFFVTDRNADATIIRRLVAGSST